MSLATTIGALLIGQMCATAVWGISSFQTFVYFNYPAPAADSDSVWMRCLVIFLWGLDTLHLVFACHAVYYYTISSYDFPENLANIVWSLPLSIAVTAIITYIVHCFFARRIYLLSRGKSIIPTVIVLLATTRMGFGFGSTVECFRLVTFAKFSVVVKWLYTTGLSLAVISDAIITGACCYYLAVNRSGFPRMDAIIKALQRYIIQSGAITTVLTGASALCAIVMSHNLIWIGAHFVISKLYTASLVAALNTRDALRESQLHHEVPREHLALSSGVGLKVTVETSRQNGDSDKGSHASSDVSRDPFYAPPPPPKLSSAFYFGAANPYPRASSVPPFLTRSPGPDSGRNIRGNGMPVVLANSSKVAPFNTL